MLCFCSPVMCIYVSIKSEYIAKEARHIFIVVLHVDLFRVYDLHPGITAGERQT